MNWAEHIFGSFKGQCGQGEIIYIQGYTFESQKKKTLKSTRAKRLERDRERKGWQTLSLQRSKKLW